MAIYKYPLQAPVPGSGRDADGVSEAIDYVVFQRSSVSYDDTGFRGYSFASSANNAKRKPNENRVYLAMPKQLNTGYAPRYRQIDLGVAGAAALSAFGADLSGDMSSLAQIIGEGARAALPEFTANAMGQVVSSLAQAGGLQGGLDGNSIQALTRGRVFNPFKEQVFQTLDFRTHTFSFKLLSRSEEEAQRVKDIIDYFKYGSLPNIAGEETSVKINGESNSDVAKFGEAVAGLGSNRFFTVPDTFDIKFMRVLENGQGADNSMHFKIHPSVCTNLRVNYTPDGQYTSFRDVKGNAVQVPAIQLDLTFAELKLVTKGDIAKGF